MKRIVSGIILALLLTGMLTLAFAPAVSGSELSIVATADSYTDSHEPDVNYGGQDHLYSCNCEWLYLPREERYIWLKFDLSKIPSKATVNSIILRMYTSIFGTTATNKVGVFLCSRSDWKEMEITWNNCPEVTGQPIDTVYVASSDTDYDFDVTLAVKGKSVVTLVLKTLEPTDFLGWAVFDSRETGETIFSDDRPRLKVEYITPPPTLDFPPLVFQSIIIGSIVILAVVMLVVYADMRKKKQPSAPTRMCPQCGRGLSPDLKFCPYCGKALK